MSRDSGGVALFFYPVALAVVVALVSRCAARCAGPEEPMQDWTVVIEAKETITDGRSLYAPQVVSYDGPEDGRQEAVDLALEQWADDMGKIGKEAQQ